MALLPSLKSFWPTPNQRTIDPDLLTKEERDTASFTDLNGPMAAAEAAWKKSMSWADYQAFEGWSDSGNFFGAEFEIRATALRIKSLYTREPWIFTTAYKVALTLSNIPLRAVDKRSKKPVPNHPLEKLANGGGPLHADKELKIVSVLDMMLGGTGFIVANEDYSGLIHYPFELIQRIDLGDPAKGQKLGIDKIIVANPQTPNQRLEVDARFAVLNKFPNPFNPFLGLSPFTAAARPILLDRHKNEFEMAFYLRGCTNAGVIETTTDMSKARMKRLIATYEQAYTGRRNWWRPVFLPKGATYKASGLSMQEMDHLEGMRENRKTILAVIGVPPAMAGLTEDVNRATSEHQNEIYYSNLIVPMAHFITSAWNRSDVVRVVGKGQVELEADFDNVEAVHGSDITKGDRAKALAPFFTINEIRKRVWRLGPVPAGDGPGDKIAQQAPKPAQGDKPQPDPVDPADKGLAALPPAQPTPRLPAGTGGQVLRLQALPAPETLAAQVKAAVTDSLTRLEMTLGKTYHRQLKAYVAAKVEVAASALEVAGHGDVQGALAKDYPAREATYRELCLPTLRKAMERGFTLGTTHIRMAKCHPADLKVRLWPADQVVKADDGELGGDGGDSGGADGGGGVDGEAMVGGYRRLDDVDQTALDVLRRRSRAKYEGAVDERGVAAFKGFDAGSSALISDVVEEGYRQGKHPRDIAHDLRASFAESYKGQMDTIARTEVLSSASLGMKQNHDALGQIFSTVQKAWLSTDGGTNPDAREEHVEWEAMGPVHDDHVWQSKSGGQLSFPRDPMGDAANVVNCGCGMITVIPDSAQSTAQEILDQE